jgi:hypothetical protein
MTDGTPISGLGPHHGRRQQEIIAIQGSTNGRFQPEQRTGAGEPMDQAVNPDERDSSVVAVAAVSLAAGLACTLAPATARLAGIDANPGVVGAVGLVDLARALGLYVGRPSWPRLLTRAASNPAIAAVSLASARSRRARLLAAGLAVATASDVRTTARLRAARR